MRLRRINHFYTFQFHLYRLTKRRPQEISFSGLRLAQAPVFPETKMKQTEGHPSAYVAELRRGDWRVVVPVRGKLSPRIAQRSFSNQKDARTWLQGETGMQAVSELRMKVSGCGQ